MTGIKYSTRTCAYKYMQVLCTKESACASAGKRKVTLLDPLVHTVCAVTQGGIPPDHVVETEDAILADMERLIKEYHDDSR